MSNDFLRAVWDLDSLSLEDLFGEIRSIRNGNVDASFFDLQDESELMAMQSTIAMRDENGWDAYYGVLPRSRRVEAGRAGSAADTYPMVTTLWADLDPYKGARSKGDVFHDLNDMTPSPSIVVDSGGGYHAYWLLSTPIEWRQAEAIMRGLAGWLSGDAVYDKPRILRLPGTHNHKTDPPNPVRLIRFDRDRRYRAGEFNTFRDEGLAIMEPPPRPTSEFDSRPLPEWLLERITRETPRGYRSEEAFAVLIWLIRYGLHDDEIELIFQANPRGVGAKMNDKGSEGGRRWLATSLAKARRVA